MSEVVLIERPVKKNTFLFFFFFDKKTNFLLFFFFPDCRKWISSWRNYNQRIQKLSKRCFQFGCDPILSFSYFDRHSLWRLSDRWIEIANDRMFHLKEISSKMCDRKWNSLTSNQNLWKWQINCDHRRIQTSGRRTHFILGWSSDYFWKKTSRQGKFSIKKKNLETLFFLIF